jgi:hypothetical protein
LGHEPTFFFDDQTHLNEPIYCFCDLALILADRVHDMLLHAARTFPDQFKHEFLRCAELRLSNVIANIKAMTIPA